MTPRVSVVTTVYNGSAYFDCAVPSVLSQTYGDFEYVIVDDGSTDGTQEFLDEVRERDSRVRVLSPGRLGFVKALNYGIRQAEGEYIARQDFDDRSFPHRLEKQVAYLDNHPQTGAVGAFYRLIDQNRNEQYIRMPPVDHEEIVRTMAKRVPMAHTLVTFRKRAWTEAGGYPEVEDIEDLRLWITFARLGWKLANVAEVLGEHWVHPQSYWHSNFRYRSRQRTLMRVQWQAIRQLDLPLWMAVYPIGRLVYPFAPLR